LQTEKRKRSDEKQRNEPNRPAGWTERQAFFQEFNQDPWQYETG